MNWLTTLFGAFQAAEALEPAAVAVVNKVVSVVESPEVSAIITGVETFFHITPTPTGGLLLTPKTTDATPAPTPPATAKS